LYALTTHGPLNVKNKTGDITHTIRDGFRARPWLGEEVRNAGEGDSDYLQYDAKVAELAVKFLEHEAKEIKDPWCLFVGFVLPHFPLRAPKEYMDLFRPFEKLPFPKAWSKKERPMHPALELMRNEMNTGDLDDDTVRKAVATYYAMTAYMDHKAGLVLDALDRSGLRNKTRIIYTDDHGDTMGDHGLFFKHSMYEGSAGVPLIMAGPDIQAGKIIEDEVSLIDIFPTVLECAGIDPKPEDRKLPGISLLEWAKNDIKPLHRPIFSEYHCVGSEHGSFMLRQGDYKLIYYVTQKPQLFNLKDDPDELNDLAENPAHAAALSRLEGLLREICDPEKVSEQAKREQRALLEKHGGREKVLLNSPLISYSPVPEGVV
jgi:choline-sulfatase